MALLALPRVLEWYRIEKAWMTIIIMRYRRVCLMLACF